MLRTVSQRAWSVARRQAVWRPSAVSVRCMADEADGGAVAADNEITLNFAVAHSAVVNNKPATRVTVPGRGGTVGIEAKAPPFLTELRPGVVSIEYEKGETESFFVPGGFAFNHKGSKVDVSAPDVAKPEDIDVDALRQRFEEAKQAFDVAAAGSQEQAKASIELEVFKAIGAEVNMKL